MAEFTEKYINPFTDFGFKKLFGTEFNKELLINFMNQVLGDREQIHMLHYLNPEHLGNMETDRKAVFDLYCENEKGEKFIIELQNAKQLYFKDRSIFYATFPIQSQGPKGQDWDYQLKAVYTIGILNFRLPDERDEERYIREIQLMDRQTNEIFYEKLTFIYLEVPKFEKQEDELETTFDKWMYVLKNLPKLREKPQKLQEKIFEKVFSEAEIAKLNPEEMKSYDQSLKIYRDNRNVVEYAKYEGKKEGIEEGKKVGIEEGRKEERIAIAKVMKKNGASTELIEKSTGLTKVQIEDLA